MLKPNIKKAVNYFKSTGYRLSVQPDKTFEVDAHTVYNAKHIFPGLQAGTTVTINEVELLRAYKQSLEIKHALQDRRRTTASA